MAPSRIPAVKAALRAVDRAAAEGGARAPRAAGGARGLAPPRDDPPS